MAEIIYRLPYILNSQVDTAAITAEIVSRASSHGAGLGG